MNICDDVIAQNSQKLLVAGALSQTSLGEEEEEEEIYLTQVINNHDNSTQIVQSQVARKTRRSTMLATHRTYKLLTYIQKSKKTHTHTHTSIHQ